MKNIDLILFVIVLLTLSACDVDYESSPNAILQPPTSGLLNDALKKTVDDLYDEWFSGRFTQVTMQYWTQSEYADEDRYAYRESQKEYWEDFYRNLENLRQVIQINTAEDTRLSSSVYGDNDNQVAVARILMAWVFNIMADTWGDIPYYAPGTTNGDFQALQVADTENEILAPAYASQSQTYPAILTELQEGANMVNPDAPGFTGDNIFDGDMRRWQLFANSLRLRIALKVKKVDPATAEVHISDALSAGVFTSNEDNAIFVYESADVNAAPIYRAFNVDNRKDFAVAHSFVELLKGENIKDHSGWDIKSNPFSGVKDPRLTIFVQPNHNGDYIGMPISESSSEAGAYTWESLPGDQVINTPNFGQSLMEFAEVSFILSELNGWDQVHYENGVRASLEKWGVSAADADAYITQLPQAGEESVLTQKYIALYMDPHTAWQEYRRTGYPRTLLKPDDFYSISPEKDVQKNYHFTSLVEGVTDLPHRMQYPDFERTLNGDHRAAAVSQLENGDVINSPLWWDIN